MFYNNLQTLSRIDILQFNFVTLTNWIRYVITRFQKVDNKYLLIRMHSNLISCYNFELSISIDQPIIHSSCKYLKYLKYSRPWIFQNDIRFWQCHHLFEKSLPSFHEFRWQNTRISSGTRYHGPVWPMYSGTRGRKARTAYCGPWVDFKKLFLIILHVTIKLRWKKNHIWFDFVE